MRTTATILVLLAALAWTAPGATGAVAEEATEFAVPLSEPGAPAVLEVGLVTGGIDVKTHDGDGILVRALLRSPEAAPSERVDGMLRIPDNSLGLEIEERDNRVEVNVDWMTNQRIDLEIRVPAKTSLELRTTQGGDIVVEGVEGDHELSNSNGGIFARDVSGSVVATSSNGRVEVSFRRVTPGKPMSFSSWADDVDVTFPPGLSADLRMRSGSGTILSDFDVELLPVEPTVERGQGGGGFQLRLEREVRGRVGGGGPEIYLRSISGAIYLRRAGDA